MQALNSLLVEALKRSERSARDVSADAGLHHSAVSRWIAEGRTPKLSDALAVGRVLGIPDRRIVDALTVKPRRPGARKRQTA